MLICIFSWRASCLSLSKKGNLYQELLELNELKNKFIGIVAHDLRNPIAVIKGYTGILLGNLLGEIPAKQRNMLGKVDNACETMLLLINDLLDVSAIESGKLSLEKQIINLKEYLEEVHETNKMLAQAKSIELQLEMDDVLPTLPLDPHRINQVLNNPDY